MLPTYNRSQVLPRAIDSVRLQDEPQWELIVVDDGSTDDTRAYLATLSDPRIRAIALPRNGGVSAARNQGLEAARADVVAFLDSDDVYLAQRLSLPLRVLAQHEDVVCTLSSLVKRSDDGRQETSHMPDVTLAPCAFEWGLACRVLLCSGTNMTVRRGAALSVGGFCPQLHLSEDLEFLMRLSRRGSARLMSGVLSQKYRSSDALSEAWRDAAKALIAFARAQPDYVTRYRKLGSYFATQILINDLRHGAPLALLRDWRALRQSGLISGNVAATWCGHRDVKRYRRRASSLQGLATLCGPPEHW